MDDKVLKITTDANEVANIEYLRKKNFHGIVDYYDIREVLIEQKGEIKKPGIWAIILEKVEPLTEEEKDIWNMINLILEYRVTPDDTFQNIVNLTSNLTFKENSDEIYNNMMGCIKNLIDTSKKYKLNFNDLHSENFGKTKEGEYKFFDIRSDGIMKKSLKLKPIICKL